MSYQRLFTNALADILLVGDWQPQAMIKRIYWLLQTEPFWVVHLVDKLYAKFNADYPNVTKKQITEFIVNDQQFLEVWHQQRHQLHIRRHNLQQIPTPPAKLNCDIPPPTKYQRFSNLVKFKRWTARKLFC